MDWRSINFDWNQARAFLVTAEEGSFSAAARSLGMTQPTLGRQVAALETSLGVALFDRDGRGLTLTPNGLDLVEHVRAMGNAANELSLSATGKSNALEGNVCISAVESASAYTLPPIIKKLRRLHPGIQIEILASNSVSDLKRREADIAIRAFRPTQLDLITRKIRGFDAQLYATPGYLEQLGNPQTEENFSHASFFNFDHSDRLLTLLNSNGFKLTDKNIHIISENHIVQWEMVKLGMGIGVMTSDIGDAEPRVKRILPHVDIYTGELWLVVHRELRTTQRIKTVFDFLADSLA